MIHFLIEIALTVLFSALGAIIHTPAFAADQAKPQMKVFRSGDVVMLSEIGAVILPRDNVLVVDMVSPPEQRPKSYQAVDLRKDDAIIMINGKKVLTTIDLSSIYDSVTIGQDVKLGIRRGRDMMIVSFPKADQASMPQHKVMSFTTQGDSGAAPMHGEKLITLGGGDGDITIIEELGLVLADSGSKIKVAGVMTKESETATAKEGDFVVAINGTKVSTLAAFNEAYDKLAEGAEIVITLDQAGKSATVTAKKSGEKSRPTIIKKTKNN